MSWWLVAGLFVLWVLVEVGAQGLAHLWLHLHAGGWTLRAFLQALRRRRK